MLVDVQTVQGFFRYCNLLPTTSGNIIESKMSIHCLGVATVLHRDFICREFLIPIERVKVFPVKRYRSGWVTDCYSVLP